METDDEEEEEEGEKEEGDKEEEDEGEKEREKEDEEEEVEPLGRSTFPSIQALATILETLVKVFTTSPQCTSYSFPYISSTWEVEEEEMKEVGEGRKRRSGHLLVLPRREHRPLPGPLGPLVPRAVPRVPLEPQLPGDLLLAELALEALVVLPHVRVVLPLLHEVQGTDVALLVHSLLEAVHLNKELGEVDEEEVGKEEGRWSRSKWRRWRCVPP